MPANCLLDTMLALRIQRNKKETLSKRNKQDAGVEHNKRKLLDEEEATLEWKAQDPPEWCRGLGLSLPKRERRRPL